MDSGATNFIKIIITLLLELLTIFTNAQFQTQNNSKDDEYYWNPVFAGDYPDPSIIRDGDTYYLVHSSFEYYPGLLIRQLKDLINWTPVTNTLHKYVGSVWAPD
jgi:xylan 1,4-beta-xylosidase